MYGNIHRLLPEPMGAGRRRNKNLAYSLIFFLLSQVGLLSAQVAYFRNYEDFIKNNPIVPSRIGSPPFWRVVFEQGRPLEIAQIDSMGSVVERWVHRYDAQGRLVQSTRYLRERLVQTRTFQSDSLQVYLLRQLVAEPNYRPICELLTVVNYDTLQRPQLVQVEDYNGQVVGVIAYYYGNGGKLLKEEIYAGNQERLVGYTQFEYSPLVTTVRQFDGEGRLRSAVSLPVVREDRGR